MKILVLGGTYFLGKAFVFQALAQGHELFLVNRGNRPITFEEFSRKLAHLSEYDPEDLWRYRLHQLVADRSIPGGMKPLPFHTDRVDVIVDCCAYSAQDIRYAVKDLTPDYDQYIMISTTDVYERERGEWLGEDAPIEVRRFTGPTGDYIAGKIEAERELVSLMEEKGKAFTILRPAFIYGPENYAPRENIYFNWMQKADQILHPVDADGKFQMVYVEDVARAVLSCCGNSEAYNEAFNICPGELITYESWADALEELWDRYERKLTRVSMAVEEVLTRGLPLPFPLTVAESNYYQSEKAERVLGLTYTPLSEGLLHAYLAFRHRSSR